MIFPEEGKQRVLAVGESNPFGSDPYFALYHLPRTSSGNRLRSIMGLSDVDYLKHVDRVNLCSGTWSQMAAVVRAEQLLLDRGGTYVLLGAKVRKAFEKALARRTFPSDLRLFEVRDFWFMERRTIVCLPHPSGRCRSWSEPGAVDKARKILSAAAQGIPWGRSLEGEKR